MLIKILCPVCNQEKEVEVKVPKFCGKECRLANFKKIVMERQLARKQGVQSEATTAEPIVAPEVPPEQPQV